MTVGVYPGSFNPPTVAHLAIARAARDQCGLERVDLVISRDALGKDDRDLVAADDRLTVLMRLVAAHDWFGAFITDRRFIADIAEGYDVVVLGGDKWAQVIDPVWYGGDEAERDAVLARLPLIAYAPRADHRPPANGVRLHVAEDHRPVSAAAVRAGHHDWMSPAARAFADETGAWVDPDRYRAWRAAQIASAGGIESAGPAEADGSA